MNKAILVLGAVLMIAGIAYALVNSYDVMVQEALGHWEPDPLHPNNVPPAHIWVETYPAIYEARYPNMTAGAIVALIGLVSIVISYALEDFDYNGVETEVEEGKPIKQSISKSQEKAATQNRLKYCIHCGEKLPDNATFCGNCGKTRD